MNEMGVDLLLEELDELREWKHGVEGMLGQRGVDNVSAMVNIVKAALWWQGCSIMEGLEAETQLLDAIEAYNKMVEEMIADATK